MPVDVKAAAINAAMNELISTARDIRAVSTKIITPLKVDDDGSNPVFLHPDNVALLKGQAGGKKAALDTAITAVQDAFAL